MIENQLDQRFVELSFHRRNTNTEGIFFYYRVEEDLIRIITIIHDKEQNPITIERYQHITNQIKNTFYLKGYSKVAYLGLLITSSSKDSKSLYLELEEDDHWLIDERNGRLRIYENQSSDFIGIKQEIEQILENIISEPSDEAQKRSRSIRLSLVNTIIVAINVMIHLLLYQSSIFSETQEIVVQGALSWQSILEDNEYFRLITAMFLHADLSHLFNNMLLLTFIGEKVERLIGWKKYLILYLGTGIIAGISSIGYNKFVNDDVWSIGASGAVFGVVGALLYIIVRCKGRVDEIDGRQMILFAMISLYSGFTNAGIDNVAHIGGFLAGILLATICYRKPKKRLE